MRKTLCTLALALTALVCNAKDIKTVVFTTNPQMSCENCENKIKGNLRFESGVKAIEASAQKQTVTISYDADKTSESKLAKALEKIGYKATKVSAKSNGRSAKADKKGSCCQGDKKAEKKSCCNEKGQEPTAGCCQSKASGNGKCCGEKKDGKAAPAACKGCGEKKGQQCKAAKSKKKEAKKD